MKSFFFFCIFFFLVFAAQGQYKIVFLGDSITEGYGVEEKFAYPNLIKEKFREDGILDVEIINSGFSGSTTSGAPSRMKWLLRSEPDLVFLALGGNDGLRGILPAAVEKNLTRAIELAKAAKTKVVLAGMQMPPNYGQEYTKKFREVFFRVAEETETPMVPFLLEGVAADPELNLPDGIHPNPEGQKIIANLVYPYLKKIYVADRK